MKWTKNLKIAIVEENTNSIGNLIKELPQFKTKESAKEALALIGEAIKVVDSQKAKTLVAMNKIKQTKAFLNS